MEALEVEAAEAGEKSTEEREALFPAKQRPFVLALLTATLVCSYTDRQARRSARSCVTTRVCEQCGHRSHHLV